MEKIWRWRNSNKVMYQNFFCIDCEFLTTSLYKALVFKGVYLHC